MGDRRNECEHCVQAVTGEGIVSVRARATDAAGNVSESLLRKRVWMLRLLR